jgi:hypothetical protein
LLIDLTPGLAFFFVGLVVKLIDKIKQLFLNLWMFWFIEDKHFLDVENEHVISIDEHLVNFLTKKNSFEVD